LFIAVLLPFVVIATQVLRSSAAGQITMPNVPKVEDGGDVSVVISTPAI
jgi:hypothetical protein